MRNILLKISVITLGSLSLLNLSPLIAYAAIDCDNPASTKEAIQCGSSNTSGVPVAKDSTQSINDTIATGINLLSTAVGIAATVMLVLGAFRYITSSGDSTKIGAAKNTILYAVIGLIIVALAQVIVHFVLYQTTTAVNGTSAKPGGGSNSPCGRAVC